MGKVNSTTLYTATDISIHTISSHMDNQVTADLVQLWEGNLRVVQEEDEEPASVLPYNSLRLKLEFLSSSSSGSASPLWAETWYNPRRKIPGSGFTIANNGDETIELLLENCRSFKVIAQLPGSGYNPIDDIAILSLPSSYSPGSSTHTVKQVALEFRFEDELEGWAFLEVLDRYHGSYAAVVDSYHDNTELLEAQVKMKNVQISKPQIHEQARIIEEEGTIGTDDNFYESKGDGDGDDDAYADDDDDDDDDFGDFIEA